MYRILLIAAVALPLAGCDMLQAGLQSRADKVNAAMPLPEPLLTARNALFAAVAEDAKLAQSLQGEFARLLEVRALACSSGAQLGRFDTVEVVQKKLPNKICFRDEDAKLTDWVGLRRVVQLAGKPALVPFAPLPAQTVLPPYGEPAAEAVVAAAANVAAVRGNRGKITLVSLPSGKEINSLAPVEQINRQPVLSPNGRLLAASFGNQALRLIDVESGTTLWQTGAYSDVLAWLPGASAAIVLQAGSARPYVLDLLKGSVEPYPVPLQRLTWAIPMPKAPQQWLVGDSHTAVLLNHSRDASGALDVSTVRQWSLAGQGVTSLAPSVFSEGRKLVYLSMRDLAWLDLQSGAQGSWAVSQLNAHGFSKVSESTLIMDIVTDRINRSARLFDIEAQTLSPVADDTPTPGLLMPLGSRPGYIRRGVSTLSIGSDPVAAGEAQSLEALIAEIHLARQLALLNSSNSPPVPATTDASRAPVSGSPEAARAAAIAAVTAARAAGNLSAPVPASPGSRPLLTGISPDAQLSVIGVYEPAMPPGQGAGPRQRGRTIRVNIAPARVPLVLALSSYEAVEWDIRNNGRPIAAVLLSGYQESRVLPGHGAPKPIVIGQQYAYKMDSAEYLALKNSLARYVANPVHLFQGRYAASEFDIWAP
jgi:hypothetical protein